MLQYYNIIIIFDNNNNLREVVVLAKEAFQLEEAEPVRPVNSRSSLCPTTCGYIFTLFRPYFLISIFVISIIIFVWYLYQIPLPNHMWIYFYAF